jgi:hypothetical protein
VPWLCASCTGSVLCTGYFGLCVLQLRHICTSADRLSNCWQVCTQGLAGVFGVCSGRHGRHQLALHLSSQSTCFAACSTWWHFCETHLSCRKHRPSHAALQRSTATFSIDAQHCVTPVPHKRCCHCDSLRCCLQPATMHGCLMDATSSSHIQANTPPQPRSVDRNPPFPHPQTHTPKNSHSCLSHSDLL